MSIKSGVELSEIFMARGLWSEARAALDRADIHPADRHLQAAALICRRDCVNWLARQDLTDMPAVIAEVFQRFDRFTAEWVLNQYNGEGSTKWRGNARANAPTA